MLDSLASKIQQHIAMFSEIGDEMPEMTGDREYSNE
jgi:hypothetical protein